AGVREDLQPRRDRHPDEPSTETDRRGGSRLPHRTRGVRRHRQLTPCVYGAIVNDILEKQASGRPTLVGTVSIEKSERLSGLRRKRGIKHVVLNAKYHAQEAEIVAQAGRRANVTIATNMAGRGTDILLGGNAEHMARQQALSEEVAERLPKGEEKFV